MPKKIVVMNGIHGSGKTTLGIRLAESVGGYFYHEVGGALRAVSSENALQSRDSFDKRVMTQELARDKELLATELLPVVETWHIGNMAYAALRSPAVLQMYLDQFEHQLPLFEPLFVFCVIGRETFMARATEKVSDNEMEQLYDFYQAIHFETVQIYRRFSLNWVAVHNEGDLTMSLQALQNALRQFT